MGHSCDTTMAGFNLTGQGHFSEVTIGECNTSESDQTTSTDSNILVSSSYHYGMVYHNNSEIWLSHLVMIS